jgi:RNA polymerase-binding protein DksA
VKTSPDTTDVRARLEDERQRLEAEIEALVRAEFRDDDPIDRREREQNAADDASATSEHEKSLALLQNLRTLRANVGRALERVEKGTYGICEDCGGEIAPERLAAIPYATLCISCKSKRERR